jgi:hypothetical protein
MENKHQQILQFFEESDIDLPIAVQNALEDVFAENDSIENVDIYFKDDYELLGEELRVINEVDVYLGQPSSGSVFNVFTYYGDIEYSVSEFVNLLDEKGGIIEDITHIDNRNAMTEANPEEFVVVLFEKLEWSDGQLVRDPRLVIYCPEILEEA